MAKKVVGREMTSKVGLDVAEAVKPLKTLTAAVKANTSGWKAQETALKSAGEYQKATAARVDGLAKSMELQKSKIDELKKRQGGLNKETTDGKDAYLKLEDQINKASRSYDSMGGQLERAKSKLQYYNSGLADLQNGYKQSMSLSKSYVERLEAEGKSAEANKAKLGGLKQAYSNMEDQYKAQTNELERIKTASGATSDAYKRQQVRVNETATSMAKLKSETNELDSAMKKSNASAFTKMLDKAKSKLGMVRSEEEKAKSETKHFAIGSAIGYSISSAASSAVGYIKEVTKQGYELAEAGGTIKKQWTNLGLSDADATKMTAQIGDIRSKANISGGAIDQMQKKFYAMTNSTTKARAMTEVIASYGSAAGKSGDQIASMSQGIGKLSGSAKVTASLFKRSFSQVPELQKAVIKASGMSTDAFNKQLAAGKITGTQLQGYMVKAAKTSGKAWSEFGDTTKGKMAAIQGTYTNLKVAFAKPLVAGVEKAIDGVSKKKGTLDDVKKSLTGLVGTLGKKTGQYVGDVISFLVKNEKPIEKTGGAIASIVGSLAKGAWSAVASALKLIGGHSKDASKGMNGIADATQNIAKHKGAIQTLGKVIITSFALSKLKGIASGFLGISHGIGKTISFVTSLSKAQRAAAKATNTQTAAQKLLDIAMDANPIALVVTAIAALSVGFYEAYKHIKPFRDAVNGMGTAMKKLFTGKFGWEKSIGKKLAGVGSTISKWGKGAGKFVSKHKSEILAGLVSPFAGLSTWFLKDTKTGKNVQKWAKGFSKDIKKMGLKKAMDKQVNDASKAFKKSKFGKWFNNINSSFNSFKKSFKKTWNKHWSDTGKTLKRDWNGSIKDTRNFFSSFGKKWDTWKSSWKKSWSSHWSSNGRTLKTNWNTSFKLTKSFFSSMGTKWAGWKKSWSHSWDSHWDKMRSNLHSYWNKDLKHTKVFGSSMGHWLDDFKTTFKGGWKNLGKGVSSIFSDLWKGLKSSAQGGMNDVIDVINGGINAVNSVIHTFGGKKTTIGDLSHVKLATGTGMLSGVRRAITKPTMAMLNDGNDSPETGNKEMIMLPNGDSGIVQGRNTKMMLPAGSEVLSASETAMVMAMQGVTKYAKGTGFFGDILNSVTSGISGVTNWVGKKVNGLEKFFKTAENIIAYPIKSLENLFSWSSKGISGVMSKIGKGLFDGTEKQAKTWWSTLWGGVGDSLGGDGSGTDSSLVKNMEKYGATNKYVWGAAGPTTFDCSGLVEYTLKKMGISFPRNSGEQYKASKHVSNPKPGDLVFFGPGGSEHVGVYTGNGKFYSAENEKDGMGISSVHGGGYGSFAGYGRVPGLSDSTGSSKSSKSSGLLGTIKKQVGSGFWSFISKLADMFGDDGGGSIEGGAITHSMINEALKMTKVPREYWSKMQSAIIKTADSETGNRNIAQTISDGNSAAGNPAAGPLQFTKTTFDAFAFPDHHNFRSSLDQVLAFLNNSDYLHATGNTSIWGHAKYDWLHSGPQGHKRFENGGIVSTNQLIEVAEKNKPEMVLPLTNKSRANQLITQADRIVNNGSGESSSAAKSTNHNQSLSDTGIVGQLKKMVQQNETLIAIVSKLLGINIEQVKAINGIKPLELGQLDRIQARRQSLSDYQSLS